MNNNHFFWLVSCIWFALNWQIGWMRPNLFVLDNSGCDIRKVGSVEISKKNYLEVSNFSVLIASSFNSTSNLGKFWTVNILYKHTNVFFRSESPAMVCVFDDHLYYGEIVHLSLSPTIRVRGRCPPFLSLEFRCSAVVSMVTLFHANSYER